MSTPIKVFAASSDTVMDLEQLGNLRSGDEGFPRLEAGGWLGLGGGKICHDSTDEKETVLIGHPQLVQALIKCGCNGVESLYGKPDVPVKTQYLIGRKFDEECGGGDAY